MLLYTGLAWCADAMEMMLLSFLGPAVSPTERSHQIINLWHTLQNILFCSYTFDVPYTAFSSDHKPLVYPFCSVSAYLIGPGVLDARPQTRSWPTAVSAYPVQCISLMLLYSSSSPRQPARQRDRQTITQTNNSCMEQLTSSSVTHGCEFAQQVSVIVCWHKS